MAICRFYRDPMRKVCYIVYTTLLYCLYKGLLLFHRKNSCRTTSGVASKILLVMLIAEYIVHEARPWLAPSEKNFKI